MHLDLNVLKAKMKPSNETSLTRILNAVEAGCKVYPIEKLRASSKLKWRTRTLGVCGRSNARSSILKVRLLPSQSIIYIRVQSCSIYTMSMTCVPSIFSICLDQHVHIQKVHAWFIVEGRNQTRLLCEYHEILSAGQLETEGLSWAKLCDCGPEVITCNLANSAAGPSVTAEWYYCFFFYFAFAST